MKIAGVTKGGKVLRPRKKERGKRELLVDRKLRQKRTLKRGDHPKKKREPVRWGKNP